MYHGSAALPSAELLRQQADWLAPARSRLLRRAAIAHKSRVLDLGAGFGAVSQELARRSRGFVVAFDLALESLHETTPDHVIFRVVGNALQLPFAEASFDLVFCQCALLWMAPLEATILQTRRVILPGGTLVAIEPDYEGMIEYPAELATRGLWISALSRAGADPTVGRKLPGLLDSAGFDVRVDLLDQLKAPARSRFEFLKDLPLTAEEQSRLARIEQQSATLARWEQIAHLPYFLIIAVRLS